MDSKTYILFDNNDHNNLFISHLFDNVIISPQYSQKVLSWLLGTFKALAMSSKNDKIICWYDFQAVLLFWICRLTFRKRYIVCLNILLKPKNTLKNRIVSFLYKVALSSRRFKATVTSVEYGKLLNKRFGRNFDYTLLHDVYHDDYYVNYKGNIEKNTVFCGGRNGRDWNFMFEVAKKMPDVKFNFVVPNSVYAKFTNEASDNVRLYNNISYDEFMIKMCESQVVCSPLDTEAPAGLIVIFQAAANDKFIIATDTATTREYVNEHKGLLLKNEVSSWVYHIDYMLTEHDIAKEKAEALHAFLKEECDEKKFVAIINQLKNNI